ncbi:MAG: 3-keto-5-aminohexanoate cleavage protein, partial [Alcaligenaceae bacterium]
GQLGAHPATPEGLRAYTDHLPKNRKHEWTVCCKSGNLFPIALSAIAQGGHIAIGIGDYAYPELGYPTNAQLVEEVVKLAKTVGREVATPAEARSILGIQPRSH